MAKGSTNTEEFPTIIHLSLHAALKCQVESVVESEISTYEMHLSGRRSSVSEEHRFYETLVHIAGPTFISFKLD